MGALGSATGTRGKAAAQFRIRLSMERDLKISESVRAGLMECRAADSVKPDRKDASAGLMANAVLEASG